MKKIFAEKTVNSRDGDRKDDFQSLTEKAINIAIKQDIVPKKQQDNKDSTKYNDFMTW